MPDFKTYATGYAWLDKLTLPFWTLYSKWHEWRFYRYLGKGDAERGREILKRAAELHPGMTTTDSETTVHREGWL